MIRLVLSLAICILLIHAPAHAVESRGVALVVGNSEYQHANPLQNPKNDAEAVAATFERLGLTVVKGIDLTRLHFEELIRTFAREARGAPVAIFFYAGHGLQVDGRNYLVPIDAKISDETDLEFETVRLETVLGQMEREQRTNLVFLDACRDNPLARNLARSMGTRSTAVGSGLARVESGVGTMISFATQPGNVALDGEGKHSPFADALLAHIETPGLDVELMMRRVRRDVMDATNERQVPWSNSSLTGGFVFKEAGETTTTAAVVPPDTVSPSVTGPIAVSPGRDASAGTLPEATPTGAAPSDDAQAATTAPKPSEPIVTAAVAPDMVTTSAEPEAAASSEPVGPELARRIQSALNRLGCDAGQVDGVWGGQSRAALKRLDEHVATLQVAALAPSAELLRKLEALDGRLCPVVCAATEELKDGACVRKSCPAGQSLSSKGICYTPRKTTSRPGGKSSGGCFTFNGQRFCN